MSPPVCGTDAGADFVIDKSELAATPACVVCAEALSLPALSSGVPDTDAVFVNVTDPVVAFAGTDTTIETVADEAPAANEPRLQVTVAVPEHVPADGADDTNDTPAGNVSVTITPVAAVFPVCDTVIE